MRYTEITSCYLGPQISPEQFIAEHFFLYLLKGKIEGFDGHKHSVLNPAESCIVRKNRLVRYSKYKDERAFEKIVIIFDEAFLKQFVYKNNPAVLHNYSNEAFLPVMKDELIAAYIGSLKPYYNGEGNIDSVFADVKREELLLLLLKLHPEYSGIFFDFGKPEKIDLEAFMNRNYKFNVDLNRFAYLTGRSLSAFKRDFFRIFHTTPGRWIMAKRLQEAYFLIDREGKSPVDIFLDLGFENLSHFSFAFKKFFGKSPREFKRGIT